MGSPAPSPRDFHNALLDTTRRNMDVMDYYVNRVDDNAYDCVLEMKQAIEWEDESGSYLFSGLRGVGKTTELKRLVKELNETNTVAFYCSADDYLDLTNPSISQAELVFCALAGLSDAVTQRYGKKILEHTIWDRTKSLMQSDVSLKPKIKSAIGLDIEFSLQENITFKQELVEFSRQSSQFFQEAHKFASELVELIHKQAPENKIVLVVDSLERLTAPSGEESTLYDSLKDLFFNYPSRLYYPNMSVIYTVPPYLHAVLPNIDSHYSGTFSLPNFKVMDKPIAPDFTHQRNQDGLAKMRCIVDKAYPEWQTIVVDEVLIYLAFLSGGNVRRLFSLIRHLTKKASLNQEELPVSSTKSDSVLQAIAEETKPLQWLNAEDRKWLETCKKTSGNLAQHIKVLETDLPPIIRLFDHSLVLNYKNGSIWYQVPPLIENNV